MITVLRQSGLFRSLIVKREFVFFVALITLTIVLACYNLDRSPRTWQDEGGTLLIARTLVEDGVYAIRTSDGYQTFGSIQSVGPTVILPLALSFKLFGIGLLQGRLVMAAWMILTIMAFFSLGRELFGIRTAILAVLLLFSIPSGMLMLGRQAIGEVPALGLMLLGYLMWLRAIRINTYRYYAAAGLLFGLAAVTKGQFIPMILGMLGICAVLNLWFYKRSVIPILLMGCVVSACIAGWIGWQIFYFGLPTFQENSAKMSDLASVTIGLNKNNTVIALKYLFGADSRHFFYFIGIPSVLYAISHCYLNTKRNDAIIITSLVIFMLLCLGYYVFWIIPVPVYFFAPASVASIFAAKLLNDVINACKISSTPSKYHIDNTQKAREIISLRTALILIIVSMLGFSISYEIRENVLSKDTGPQQVGAFLKQSVPPMAVIETWERELGILTNHTYHYPDQIHLKDTQGKIFRNIQDDYALGSDYFQKIKPDYLVIGWYARHTDLYDTSYLSEHACFLSTFGDGDWRYDVYRINQQSRTTSSFDQIPACSLAGN
jgi:4-amino-4-deoxy-L-arabinose transferase-like glycosyltransferase